MLFMQKVVQMLHERLKAAVMKLGLFVNSISVLHVLAFNKVSSAGNCCDLFIFFSAEMSTNTAVGDSPFNYKKTET